MGRHHQRGAPRLQRVLPIKSRWISPTKLGSNLRWGITGGLWVAAFYCIWVTGLYVVRGPEPFERNGVTFLSTIFTYLAIGIVGGGLVGLLRPFSGERFGAYGIGVLVGLLGAFALTILIAGSPARWELAEWGTIPFVAVGGGWAIGSELRKRRRDVP